MVARERGLVLHVGITKTGSRSLQAGLFAHHSQIYFLGKWKEKPHREQGCLSPTVYEVFRPLIWDHVEKPAAAERLWREQLLPTIPADKQPVASWASLGTQDTPRHRERLHRIKSVFGRCRLLFAIRNPLTHVPAEYLQQLRGHAIYRTRPWMGRRLYVDIQDWYDRSQKELGGVSIPSNYAWNIRASVEELGEENVGVFLFEGLKEDPAAYYSAICRFMGIDAAEGIRLTKHAHLNPRMREHHLERIKEIDRSFWKRFRFDRKTPQERKFDVDRAGGAPTAESLPVEAVVPQKLSDAVAKATREGNQWLVERLSLPLEKYGYPL